MEFMIVAVSSEDRAHFELGAPRDAFHAALLGWDDQQEGIDALEALAIGETVLDEDDDTWERVS